MLQWEHSAILLTFIKLPFVIKIFALSIFECPFYTGYAAHSQVLKLMTVVLNGRNVINIIKFCCSLILGKLKNATNISFDINTACVIISELTYREQDNPHFLSA